MLKVGCFGALIGCALVGLQWARIVPPVGLSWGDGNRRGGTGYSVGLLEGSLIFETLYGVKPWAPGTGGSAIKFDGEPTGFAGFNYRRYDIRLASPDGKRLPGTYGTQTRFWIAPGWMFLVSLGAAVFCCRKIWANQRSRDREVSQRCRHCGYDLRATPDRCPEMFSVLQTADSSFSAACAAPRLLRGYWAVVVVWLSGRSPTTHEPCLTWLRVCVASS
jgi:hypothetical protein